MPEPESLSALESHESPAMQAGTAYGRGATTIF
jgi:hypothetical protein